MQGKIDSGEWPSLSRSKWPAAWGLELWSDPSTMRAINDCKPDRLARTWRDLFAYQERLVAPAVTTKPPPTVPTQLHVQGLTGEGSVVVGGARPDQPQEIYRHVYLPRPDAPRPSSASSSPLAPASSSHAPLAPGDNGPPRVPPILLHDTRSDSTEETDERRKSKRARKVKKPSD